MKKIELPVINFNDKEFQSFLKQNKVKTKIVGEWNGFLMVEIKGEIENLKNVIDDPSFGWDGNYEEDWIKDC